MAVRQWRASAPLRAEVAARRLILSEFCRLSFLPSSPVRHDLLRDWPCVEEVAMTMIVRVFATFALLTLCACTTVSTTNPIGIAKGAVEDAKLMGSWRFIPANDKDSKDPKDVAFAFFVTQPNGVHGLLVLPGENEWWEAEIVIGKAGANGMLNVRPAQKNGEPVEGTDKLEGYFPLRYSAGADGTISLFLWTEDALKDAIEKKQVAGTVANGAITLTAAPDALDAFFSTAAPDIFSEPYATLAPLK
jgi:hypothetical protein